MNYDKAGKSFDCCGYCGVKLKEVGHPRNKVIRCRECVFLGLGLNTSKNTKDTDDEDWSTQDDPRAINEPQYGRVSRQPTVMNYGVSDLSDIMLDSGPYRHKHGSARDGTRFTYKKKK